MLCCVGSLEAIGSLLDGLTCRGDSLVYGGP